MGRAAATAVHPEDAAPALALGACALVASIAILLLVCQQTVVASGMDTAQAVASQVINLRQFYTAEIISRAQSAGLRVSYDYAGHRDVRGAVEVVVPVAQVAERIDAGIRRVAR